MRFLIHVLLFAAVIPALPVHSGDEISPAEHRVFLDEHLGNVSNAVDIRYTFTQKSDARHSFTDAVTLKVGAGSAKEREIDVEFLSGARRMDLASIEGGTGNPVILYFLEHDIRDLHDRLGGQAAFFRKRIRLALADSAVIKPVSLQYGGKRVNGTEVTITPYLNDPLKDRLRNFVTKTYVFTLSSAVPGGVYELRTHVDAGPAESAQPAIDTVLRIGTEST